MRIALFHNTPSGGAKRAIYEWTRRLSAMHQIDVYTLSSADHAFCDIRPFVQRHHLFEFTPQRLFRRPWGRLNQFQRWRDLNELLQIGKRIADEINSDSYDLLFAHTCLYTHIPTVLQFVKHPAVYYLHEPFGRRFTRQFQRPYLQHRSWQTLVNQLDPLIQLYTRRLDTIQRNSVHRATCLLANSQFTKARMESAFAVEPQLCHYGVNTEKFYPLPGNQRSNFVLSVGELTPRKGFDFLIESLGHVAADNRPPLKLACNMVNAQEKAYIEALARQHNVELQILTRLDADQLRVQYNQARLCLYAPVLEPFGLVPLEAMACGTAVIGVREGGVQESVVHEQTGLLVARDPAKFAAAIESLLANPTLAAHYGQNGRAQVLNHWTWHQAVADLEKQLMTVHSDKSREGRQYVHSTH